VIVISTSIAPIFCELIAVKAHTKYGFDTAGIRLFYSLQKKMPLQQYHILEPHKWHHCLSHLRSSRGHHIGVVIKECICVIALMTGCCTMFDANLLVQMLLIGYAEGNADIVFCY
jgi:hypothetical protein